MLKLANLKHSKVVAKSTLVLAMVFLPLTQAALATTLGNSGGTGGIEFKPLYDFIYAAGTGYLGRTIAIAGGIIGLGVAAAIGKVIPALIGIMLAIFGVMGPSIVNGLFTSALI